MAGRITLVWTVRYLSGAVASNPGKMSQISPCSLAWVVYLLAVFTDRKSPWSSSLEICKEDQLGFVLEVDGAAAPMLCQLVSGFREAIAAAHDPRLPMPSRLVIVRPDVTTFAWLAAWSEDDVQVRRTLTIRRRADGAAVVAVATIAAFGRGTPTMLVVESTTVPTQKRRIVRSGVHPKSFLAAICAHHKRSLQQPSANDVRPAASEVFSPDPSNVDVD